MNFADVETIANFLEEHETELAAHLDGDDAKAARLIAEFQTFLYDALSAEDYMWTPNDEDDDREKTARSFDGTPGAARI